MIRLIVFQTTLWWQKVDGSDAMFSVSVVRRPIADAVVYSQFGSRTFRPPDGSATCQKNIYAYNSRNIRCKEQPHKTRRQVTNFVVSARSSLQRHPNTTSVSWSNIGWRFWCGSTGRVLRVCMRHSSHLYAPTPRITLARSWTEEQALRIHYN